MRLSAILPTLILASTTFAAPFFAVVHNNCPTSVYVTSVAVNTGKTEEVRSHQTWMEQLYLADPHVGTAIKVTHSLEGLWTGKPTLTAAYTWNAGASIYYDLSSVYGFDFDGATLKLGPGVDGPKDAETIVWNGKPLPQHTAAHFGDMDLVLDLCA